MRILVIGAGASIEEASRVAAPKEFWPPAISNFAEKMWDSPHNQFGNYWLSDYLTEQGIDPGDDPTSKFITLANDPSTLINVERLFEYCWVNRGKKFEGDWENLIDHGVLNPLTFLLIAAFCENGTGVKQLEAGKLVSERLQDGDLVLNLNYDTLFEIAATQQGRQLTYVPNRFKGKGLIVAKPHGSLNLLADEKFFHFAQPDCIGVGPSSANNFRSHRAIVPPRFNKTYAEHPIARIIFDSITGFRPDVITFWGIGFTDSDVDLIDVYNNWQNSVSVIEAINPDRTVADRLMTIFNKRVRHCATLDEWFSL